MTTQFVFASNVKISPSMTSPALVVTRTCSPMAGVQSVCAAILSRQRVTGPKAFRGTPATPFPPPPACSPPGHLSR